MGATGQDEKTEGEKATTEGGEDDHGATSGCTTGPNDRRLMFEVNCCESICAIVAAEKKKTGGSAPRQRSYIVDVVTVQASTIMRPRISRCRAWQKLVQ